MKKNIKVSFIILFIISFFQIASSCSNSDGIKEISFEQAKEFIDAKSFNITEYDYGSYYQLDQTNIIVDEELESSSHSLLVSDIRTSNSYYGISNVYYENDYEVVERGEVVKKTEKASISTDWNSFDFVGENLKNHVSDYVSFTVGDYIDQYNHFTWLNNFYQKYKIVDYLFNENSDETKYFNYLHDLFFENSINLEEFKDDTKRVKFYLKENFLCIDDYRDIANQKYYEINKYGVIELTKTSIYSSNEVKENIKEIRFLNKDETKNNDNIKKLLTPFYNQEKENKQIYFRFSLFDEIYDCSWNIYNLLNYNELITAFDDLKDYKSYEIKDMKDYYDIFIDLNNRNEIKEYPVYSIGFSDTIDRKYYTYYICIDTQEVILSSTTGDLYITNISKDLALTIYNKILNVVNF